MNIPNIWGQGQLFAFSAVDGNSYMTDDFVGTLSADRLGIRFYSKIKRELAVLGCENDIEHKAVCSDYICTKVGNSQIRFVYAKPHLTIGDIPQNADAAVFVEGKHDVKEIDGVIVHDTHDGDFTAFCLCENKFAFAYAHSAEEAAKLAKFGLSLNIDAEADLKIDFYKKHQFGGEFGLLYAKCASVMKTQLYSPEGIFENIWSTPDRLPHKFFWLWDSVFHAVGYKNIDASIAEDLIIDIFATQYDDGMIPHMASPDGKRSRITQPPIIAWGAWKVYQKSQNKNFLRVVFDGNKKFLKWCKNNRRCFGNLYTWNLTDDASCRCDESGMDNSPRFDGETRLGAIDFSCYMANDMRYMAKIASELGVDGSYFENEFIMIKNDINGYLWNTEDEFYYDYDINGKKPHKIKSIASFLPFFAGVCDENHTDKLLKHLLNKAEFNTEMPMPSISRDDPTYGTDMWRGPVWINFCYFIISGLFDCGFADIATALRERVLSSAYRWYKNTGTVFEFYDSEDRNPPSRLIRKGKNIEPYNCLQHNQSIRDYGFSCALLIDLIAN